MNVTQVSAPSAAKNSEGNGPVQAARPSPHDGPSPFSLLLERMQTSAAKSQEPAVPAKETKADADGGGTGETSLTNSSGDAARIENEDTSAEDPTPSPAQSTLTDLRQAENVAAVPPAIQVSAPPPVQPLVSAVAEQNAETPAAAGLLLAAKALNNAIAASASAASDVPDGIQPPTTTQQSAAGVDAGDATKHTGEPAGNTVLAAMMEHTASSSTNENLEVQEPSFDQAVLKALAVLRDSRALRPDVLKDAPASVPKTVVVEVLSQTVQPDATSNDPIVSAPLRHEAGITVTSAPQASAVSEQPTLAAAGDFTIKSLRYMIANGEHSFKVRLVPESLGELHFEVKSTNDVVSVRLVSANPVVRDALESQTQGLRHSLASDGIDVSTIVVAAHTSSGQTPQGQAERSFLQNDSSANAGSRSVGASVDSQDSPPRWRAVAPHDGLLNVYA